MKNNSIHRSYFTLVELLVSMGVFSLIMLSLLTLFNSSQKIWARSTAKDSLYSNARVALDLLTYDIQCALINNDADLKGKYPFWLRKDNQINMITATPYSGDGVSNICEVKYALADDDADTETFPMDVTPAENVDETK
ncbi:MAG: type II secretion system protein, partial [Victivallales bacterium]|nr:type II secretion system protein [Victivallales bacterium]